MQCPVSITPSVLGWCRQRQRTQPSHRGHIEAPLLFAHGSVARIDISAPRRRSRSPEVKRGSAVFTTGVTNSMVSGFIESGIACPARYLPLANESVKYHRVRNGDVIS